MPSSPARFRRANVRTAKGRLPRVHDLRHTYAVHARLDERKASPIPAGRKPRTKSHSR
jgi:hypothetical protein